MQRPLCSISLELAGLCFILVLSSMPLPAAFVPGDEHWDAQLGWSGPGGNNFAVTTHNGRIYACGGSVGVNHVALAVWDGVQWSAMSQFYAPSSAVVYDLAFVGDTLYAAGIFTNVDGVAVTNLARWDGTTWSGVGWSKGTPMALAVEGGNLYVGGTFTNVAGVAMKNVGVWDGSAWHALGAGLGDTNSTCLYALTVTNGIVYAGGIFTNSGSSVLSSNVARWDGSHWSSLGGGLDSEVMSLAVKGTELYAGGFFGSPSATALAKWDGASWSLCGSGFGAGAQGIGVVGDQVCVAGNFAGINGGVKVSMFAVWNGTSWAAAGSGLSGSGLRVCSTGTNVLVGGNFLLAGGLLANGVAAWDGANWSVFGPPGRNNGLSGTVTAIASDGTNLYAGGSFRAAGPISAIDIARFDGTNWNALGTGLSGSGVPSVKAIAINGSDVYVGGWFTGAGGVPVQNIARWDGTTWNAVGDPGGAVTSITVRPDGIYVAGAPYNGYVYGTPFFLRWDGASWNTVLAYDPDDTLTQFYLNDTSPGMNAAVFLGSDIYVGGHFKITWHDPTFTTFVDCTNIMRFDGTYARIVGTGFDSYVVATAVLGNDLYVAGQFTTAGGVAASHIAKWDGNAWSGVGGGQVGTGSIYALAAAGGVLYASGNFTNMGGVTAASIARWDGSTWSTLASGVAVPGTTAATASALALCEDDVFTAGNFKMAGGKPSYYLARWNDRTNFHTPNLVNPAWLPGRQFRTRLVGVAGLTNVIQATTNFNSWTPVSTNSVGLYDFTDTAAASYQRRFYRAMLGH